MEHELENRKNKRTEKNAVSNELWIKVFDNTPAARDGTLESGDEIVGVNGTNVKVQGH